MSGDDESPDVGEAYDYVEDAGTPELVAAASAPVAQVAAHGSEPAQHDEHVEAWWERRLCDMMAADLGGTVVAVAPLPEPTPAEKAREKARQDSFEEHRLWQLARECPEAWVSRAANMHHWGHAAGWFQHENGRNLDAKVTSRLLRANGWGWYMQSRSERRAPRCLREKGEMSVKAVGRVGTTEAEDRVWRERAFRGGPTHPNVAIVMGEHSRTWALDSDIKDKARAAFARRLADEVFGPTPFTRVRLDTPKFTSVYRFAPDHDWSQAMPSKAEWLTDLEAAGTPELKPDRDAVEYKGSGGTITAHGRHYRDGYPFLWEGPLPGMDEGAGPHLAPAVTMAQVREFARRLREEAPGVVVGRDRRTASGEVAEYDEAGDDEAGIEGLTVPGRRLRAGALRDAEGRLTDCRESYTWEVVKRAVAINGTMSESQAVAVVMAALDRDVAYGGERSREDVLEDVHEKVPRALAHKAARIREGEAARTSIATVRGVDAEALPAPAPARGDAELDALLPGRTRLEASRTAPDEAAREARRLLDGGERTAQAARVSAETEAPIRRWLDAVWDARQGVRKVGERELLELNRAAGEVILLLGPTGSGKTTTLLRLVKEQIDRRGRIGPILFMAPSYALLDEVMGKAGGTSALAESAEEAATLAAMGEAEGMGLVTLKYQGKGKLCSLEAGKLIAAARMSLSHMCESKVPEMGSREPGAPRRWTKVSCSKRETCRAWLQLAAIPQSDIVFLPTAFVSLPVPKELKDCVALVVDESVAGRFLRSDSLSLSSLSLPRREPHLSQREKDAGEDSGAMMQTRDEVNAHIREAAARLLRDPSAPEIAAALLDAEWTPPHGPDGQPLRDDKGNAVRTDPRPQVLCAKNVCGRAADSHRQISPDMPTEVARALVATPLGTDLWGEWHLHTVLLDRMDALVRDRANARTHADALRTNPDAQPLGREARGTHDRRIQVLTATGEDGVPAVRIRVSWRAKNSFGHLPTLLMDASASVPMVEKLWDGRPVIPCHAPARLHMRTVAVIDRSFADSSMQPWRHQSEARRQEAAATLDGVRGVIDLVAGMYGHSQVVLASTKGIEVSLQTSWLLPPNVSPLHYGAVVGLDFAKAYPAAVIVGRQELPHDAVDAVVGALTYDDPDPERPVDYLGTGFDAKGNAIRTPVAERPVLMRDGSDVVVSVPTHAGRWAAIVQAQAREEQLRQAIGRLRPVYRDGEAPLVVVLGRCLPPDLVVDAVCALDDLRGAAATFSRARETAWGLTAEDGYVGLGNNVERRLETFKFKTKVIADRPWEDMTHRLARGMVRYRYEAAACEARHVDVLAYADPLEAVRVIERAMGREWEGSVTEVLRPVPMDDLEPRRPDDRMTALVGDPEARAAAWERTLAEVRESAPVVRLTREGEVAKERCGKAQTLIYREAGILVAVGTRPVAGACVNAPPVEAVAVEAVDVVEAAPAVDKRLTQAWRDAPLVPFGDLSLGEAAAPAAVPATAPARRGGLPLLSDERAAELAASWAA